MLKGSRSAWKSERRITINNSRSSIKNTRKSRMSRKKPKNLQKVIAINEDDDIRLGSRKLRTSRDDHDGEQNQFLFSWFGEFCSLVNETYVDNQEEIEVVSSGIDFSEAGDTVQFESGKFLQRQSNVDPED